MKKKYIIPSTDVFEVRCLNSLLTLSMAGGGSGSASNDPGDFDDEDDRMM